MSQQFPPRFRPGHRVGHYRIEGFIARGSVSEVYQATSNGAGTLLALKILVGGRETHADPSAAARHVAYFLREAGVTAALNHPSIVGLHEVGYDPGAGYYMALEYLPGKTLEETVQEEGPFPEPRAREIAMQVLNALAVAHRQKILHRDLKPGNIKLVNAPGEPDHVKLFDFGIAKVIEKMPKARELTRTGTLVGTPMWMSPEQCRGHELGPKSDLYSLGAVLYYLLAGHPPFEAGTLYQVLNAVLESDPVPIAKARRRAGQAPISRTLTKAIARALAKDPDQRFIDADHFQTYLDRDLPSSDWPSIPSGLLAEPASRDCPGLIALRLHSARPGSQPAVELVKEALRRLSEVDSSRVECIAEGPLAASVVLLTAAMPSTTMVETAAIALRLHKMVVVDLGAGPTTLLVATGDPDLGEEAPPEVTPPLLEHQHRVLEDHVNAAARSWGAGHTAAVTDASFGAVFAMPEWSSALRPEFRVARQGGDIHAPLRLMGLRPLDGLVPMSASKLLVLETLCVQQLGIQISDLEEVLFQMVEPIEVLSAMSDLQSSGSLEIDADGVARLGGVGPEGMPSSQLLPSESRFLHLRMFSHFAARSDPSAQHHIMNALSMEATHRASAARRWIVAARSSAEPEAERCLNRALRLAATQLDAEVVAEIRERLRARTDGGSDEEVGAAPPSRAQKTGTDSRSLSAE